MEWRIVGGRCRYGHRGGDVVETIYALSSGRGRTGIAVFRLSGPATRFVFETMCGPLPLARVQALRSIRNRSGLVLDRGLVSWFPGPQSFSGEDMAEFHVHGGRAVIAALETAFASFGDVRAADAGEFTRRALLNGKMDLTEVEGLGDLLAAETEAQRAQALAQSGGALGRLYDDWRTRLVRARAMIEADLDFSEEEDVTGSVVDVAFAEIATLIDAFGRHLADAHRGERLREGFQVVLLGAPNAGKSSLLNALARRDVAIVSEIAGTTRDIVEAHLDLGGHAVTVVDTAGLREAEGAIEQEGIRRALRRGERADLVLWVVDPTARAKADAPVFDSIPIWKIESKGDLISGSGPEDSFEDPELPVFRVSAVTGDGLDVLVRSIAGLVGTGNGDDDSVPPTRIRHRNGIVRARASLERASACRGAGLELVAEELRSAADELGRLTGRIGVEDYLDLIFGEFCIGK